MRIKFIQVIINKVTAYLKQETGFSVKCGIYFINLQE